MDFSLSAEQLRLRNAVIEFAGKKLRDDVIKGETHGAFSRAHWEECAKFGIQGLSFPEEYGGLNFDILTTVIVMEGLGYACKDNGLIFGLNAQMWSVQMPILRFGSHEQKNKFLPKLCSGLSIGAHGMTEPDSGSDAFNLRTTAKLQDDHYLLNGSKTFVTNAPVADVFVVFATVDKRKGFLGITGFLVEKGMPGFSVGKEIKKMGLNTSPMAELIFDDCKVPVENRLGKEGNGAAVFNDSMEWERSFILASCLGAMERQLEACVKYAKERKQFKKPIGTFQSVANKLVDMKIRLETARLLLYKAAWVKKTEGKAGINSAIVKLYLSECWLKSCLDAIQIHGGYGYTTEYGIERDLRDSVGSTIYSGTSEMQKNIIAQYLGL